MIDVINFPDGKTIECYLDELPSSFVKKVKLHIPREEKPLLCVIDKALSIIGIYVITPFRVITLNIKMSGPYVVKDDYANQARSVLLSSFIGLDEVKFEKNEQELRLRFNSTELSILFHDEELLYKFAGTFLSAVNLHNN